MSLTWIRRTYGVPARRGGRVLYTYPAGQPPRLGTICGAAGSHLRIRLDGDRRSRRFHPTWELVYL